FQAVSGHGTRVSLFVFRRTLFTFSLTSRLDDQNLIVSGRFQIANNTWAPYVGGADGLLIPLPRGFHGAILADRDQGEVAVVPGEGYRVVRPIPPGGKDFHGAFALPVEAGKVEWSLDLPLGTDESGL